MIRVNLHHRLTAAREIICNKETRNIKETSFTWHQDLKDICSLFGSLLNLFTSE